MRIIAEPLAHFLIAGLVLFWAGSIYQRQVDVYRIIQTPERIALLAQRYALQFAQPGSGDGNCGNPPPQNSASRVTLIHAALLPARRAWVEPMAACAALCLALPLLNWMTTHDHALRYWLQANWQRLGVELTSIVFGAEFLYGAIRVHLHTPSRAA